MYPKFYPPFWLDWSVAEQRDGTQGSLEVRGVAEKNYVTMKI